MLRQTKLVYSLLMITEQIYHQQNFKIYVASSILSRELMVLMILHESSPHEVTEEMKINHIHELTPILNLLSLVRRDRL